MSTQGVLELMISLGTFRNVDLQYQGAYQLRISCSSPMSPYMVQENTLESPNQHAHFLYPPRLLDQECKVSSRSFFVRYNAENIEIHETGIFRGNFDMSSGYLGSPLLITFELYFSDIPWDTTSCRVKTEDLEEPKYLLAAKAEFTVQNPLLGVNQFVPVVFHDSFASVVTCSVHCMMTEYEFLLGTRVATGVDDIASIIFQGSVDVLENEEIEQVYHSYAMLLALTHDKIRRLLSKILKSAMVTNRNRLIPRRVKLPLTARKSHPANFTDFLLTRNKTGVTRAIYSELVELASLLCEIKHTLLNTLGNYPGAAIDTLEASYHSLMKNRWSENIISDVNSAKSNLTPDRATSMYTEGAELRRNNYFFTCMEPLEVEDHELFPRAKRSPIIFEEICPAPDQSNAERGSRNWIIQSSSKFLSDAHLFIIVHGFMCTAYDMKSISETVASLHPTAILLVATSNEGNTEGDIAQMGLRLANEVEEYIKKVFRRGLPCRISFIGHSLGGVIIRAALPHLSIYKERMHMLLTFNSPHLGCCNGNSRLVHAGLWVFMKLKKSPCLEQLSLTDNPDTAQTFLYKLAQESQLSWFKYLLLVGSDQDNYVPFESARIESKSYGPTTHIEMVNSLVSGLSMTKLIRINVNFGLEDSSILGLLVGIKTHAKILNSRALLTMLIYRYSEAFF